MPDLPLSGSRRKRLTETGSSSREGGGSFLPTMIALVLGIVLAAYLIAPNQVDNALGRTATAVAGKGGATNEVWNSVVTALTSEDAERGQIANAANLSNYTVLQQNQSVATGSVGRIVLTQGHDILQMGPKTTIAVGAGGPNAPITVIKLIDGTIQVKAAKRTDGRTFSVETQFLVATVKGTKFDVVTTPGGAAVSVTEGLVSVRKAGSSDGVDVTPGNTAVVSAFAGAAPVVGPTPSGGSPAAIEAAKTQPASTGTQTGTVNGNQDSR